MEHLPSIDEAKQLAQELRSEFEEAHGEGSFAKHYFSQFNEIHDMQNYDFNRSAQFFLITY